MKQELEQIEGHNLPLTPTPEAMIANAQEQAKALMDVVEQQHLYQMLRGKKFLNVEAWQLVASFTGLSATIEYSKPLTIDDDIGYEARAVVHDKDGAEVAAGESECRKSEKGKQTHSHNQLRSMAQTRAISKALRNKLAFIVVMAGYASSTAEEMDEVKAADSVNNGNNVETTPAVTVTKHQNANQVTVALFNEYKENCLNYVDEATMNKIASNLKLGGKRIADIKKTELDDLLAACMDFKESNEEVKPFIFDEGGENNALPENPEDTPF